MKKIALTILVILLCSCNKELMTNNSDQQVQISAEITSATLSRVTEDGKAFSDGDAIKVQNMDRENKNLATYTYSASTGVWNTTDQLYWDGAANNTFKAWYPAAAEYDTFTIPSDQSSAIAEADWMTASAAARKADGNVKLAFGHHLAKVTMTIDAWSNEYDEAEKTVNSLELKSLSSEMSFDGTLSGDKTVKWIKTYSSKENISYLAIIAPGVYASSEEIMRVYVNGATEALSVRTSSEITIESGKAYSFRLTIGKDLAAISTTVSVSDWGDEQLDDQQAIIVNPNTSENIEYVLSQGYASEGTLNNNASHRVKTNFIYGNFSVKVNDGYVIRAIYTYPTAAVTSDYTCVLANSTDCKEMNVMNEGRYAVITFANASDPNATIAPTEDIIKSLKKYEIDLPESPGCPYINSAVFFGDSIMHGVYSYFETGTDGTTLRKNGFDSNSNSYLRIPDYFGLLADASVTNNAKRGSGWITDTRNLGNALEMVNKTDFTQYDFAAFCLGINDWIQGAQIGSLDEPGKTGGSISEGTVVANMTACIEKVMNENPECKIVVYSPYISWGQYSDGGDYTSKVLYGDKSSSYALGTENKAGYTLQHLIDVIDEVCLHYGVRHVPLSQSKVCTIDNVKDIMIDGLHPSREIRLSLAEEILNEGIKDMDDDSGVNMKPEDGNM